MNKDKHLRIETIPHRPKGGQQCGLIPRGVKVTHLPTGLTASCECERSQFKNKAIAIVMIEIGLAQVSWCE